MIPRILTIILLCTAFIGAVKGQVSKTESPKPQNFRKTGSPLPEIKIVDLAGVSYTKTDITEDRNFFLVMFKPTCEHCAHFAKMIMEHKENFEDNTVMFMASSEMTQHIPRFMGEVDWESDPDLILGVDDAKAVDVLYNYVSLPQINIYDRDHKLIKILSGEVSMADLEPYIK